MLTGMGGRRTVTRNAGQSIHAGCKLRVPRCGLRVAGSKRLALRLSQLLFVISRLLYRLATAKR